MSELDEISRAIGSLEATTKGTLDHVSSLHVKVDELHADLGKIKLANARASGIVGVISAISTLGAIEGVKYWLRHHGGA